MEEVRGEDSVLGAKFRNSKSVSRSQIKRYTLKNIGENMVQAEHEQIHMPLLGDDAPAFKAVTTEGPINFPDDYKGKWVILFSHPADFTPVCTTEFMTFASMQEDFKKINTELIGLSIDSVYSHIAWLKRIEEKIEYNGMKNLEVKFPVIEDLKMDVAKKYGMIQPNASTTQAVRAVFIIDPESKIRTILYYPQSTGRNMQEIKRVVMALQKNTAEKVATPANWQPGDDVIIPAPSSMEAVKERAGNSEENMYCLDWFLCLKKDSKK